MNIKKTGLGRSLLLRRTTPKPPERPDAQAPEPSEQGGRQDEEPASRRPQPKNLRDKCTLYLDADVNEQLDAVARIERKQRSEVATELLRAHLPKYEISRE
jgi:hypothetical protein